RRVLFRSGVWGDEARKTRRSTMMPNGRWLECATIKRLNLSSPDNEKSVPSPDRPYASSLLPFPPPSLVPVLRINLLFRFHGKSSPKRCQGHRPRTTPKSRLRDERPLSISSSRSIPHPNRRSLLLFADLSHLQDRQVEGRRNRKPRRHPLERPPRYLLLLAFVHLQRNLVLERPRHRGDVEQKPRRRAHRKIHPALRLRHRARIVESRRRPRALRDVGVSRKRNRCRLHS